MRKIGRFRATIGGRILIISRYSGALWAYPLKVTANDNGIDGLLSDDVERERHRHGERRAAARRRRRFQTRRRARQEWGDWTIAFRCAQSPQKYMDRHDRPWDAVRVD
jgi:hypothetical protein